MTKSTDYFNKYHHMINKPCLIRLQACSVLLNFTLNIHTIQLHVILSFINIVGCVTNENILIIGGGGVGLKSRNAF